MVCSSVHCSGFYFMSFDVGDLNAACLDIGDDAVLVTSGGPKPITVIVTISPDIDSSGGFDVMTDRVTAETTASEITGMSRKDTISHNGVDYVVLAWEVDATGWVVIELEQS